MKDLAVFHTFVRPPWGGGNQFMRALCCELARRGLRISYNILEPGTTACLFNSFNFDFNIVRDARQKGCRMVHRVDGPVAVYRGMDDGTDRRLWNLNSEIADATILQSRYSLEKHEGLGMKFRSPVIIRNAVDPHIFYPAQAGLPLKGRKIKLLSSSWSTNINKGFSVYQWLDTHLDWARFEYTFVGRTPVQFARIRVVEALPSDALAELMREHDIYITASLHDPSSNALLEALSCGLPALYAASGGHAEIVGDAGVSFEKVEEIPLLLDHLSDQYDRYASAINVPTIKKTADAYLEVLGLTCDDRVGTENKIAFDEEEFYRNSNQLD